VADYVPRPRLQRKIKEQLHDARGDGAGETWTLVVGGLGGSANLQLLLSYFREYRREYSAGFWIEARQKEAIEREGCEF
jgi:hypothetical protein